MEVETKRVEIYELKKTITVSSDVQEINIMDNNGKLKTYPIVENNSNLKTSYAVLSKE